MMRLESGRPPRGRPPQGFTLLEVMVSLSVLAIGIVTVMELFSGSLRLADMASRRTQAVIYAREVMDGLFAGEMLEDGEESGKVGERYSWVSYVQEVTSDEDGRFRDIENTRFPIRLKELEVRVRWQGRTGPQEFMLRSLRMVKVRP
jgi:prepilin-type N-terminal cleavage/methylation domain-containing protein